MRKPTARSRIEALTAKFEPQLKLAFAEAVADIVSRAELGRIVKALERGDIAAAIEAVHLDSAAFGGLSNAIAQAFDAGGADTIAALPKLRDATGNALVVRWNGRLYRAENLLRQNFVELSTRMTDDMELALRNALVRGLEAGRGPKSVALDIVGRINRVTGKREGGIIGLTSQQEAQLAEVRAILADPDRIREYFIKDQKTGRWKPRYNRTPRLFDSQVRKAISEGRALSSEAISKLSTIHSNRLLQLRGETIAQHETFAAIGQAQEEAMQQAIDSGGVKAEHVTKTWYTAKDRKVRDSHASQEGETVAFNERFSNGLRFPHDPDGPLSETIGCRCISPARIDYTAGLIERELALAGLI